MIVQYIQSVESQEISKQIHYQRMQAQYAAFIWNGEPNEVPENKATPERIQEIWKADKVFLDCTKNEAIEKYSLAGFDRNGIPYIKYDSTGELMGVTKLFSEVFTVEEKDSEENVTATYYNCIAFPSEGLENYDLEEYTYKVIEVNYVV